MTQSEAQIKAEYEKTWDLRYKYGEAKRTGWATPGSRKKDNEAILVSRKEAVESMKEWGGAIYRELVAANMQTFLLRMIQDHAKNTGNFTVGPKCGTAFLHEYLDGQCPFCSSMAYGTEETRRILGGGTELIDEGQKGETHS